MDFGLQGAKIKGKFGFAFCLFTVFRVPHRFQRGHRGFKGPQGPRGISLWFNTGGSGLVINPFFWLEHPFCGEQTGGGKNTTLMVVGTKGATLKTSGVHYPPLATKVPHASPWGQMDVF